MTTTTEFFKSRDAARAYAKENGGKFKDNGSAFASKGRRWAVECVQKSRSEQVKEIAESQGLDCIDLPMNAIDEVCEIHGVPEIKQARPVLVAPTKPKGKVKMQTTECRTPNKKKVQVQFKRNKLTAFVAGQIHGL